MNLPSVGWIGLGNMGIPMCRNLIKADYPLSVYNRTKEKEKSLTDAGASSFESATALLTACDIMFTMVSDDEAVKKIYVGEEGLLSNDIGKGKLIINTSTISPETSKWLAAQCNERGVTYLEAPVSGSVKPAEDAALIILAGGPKEAFDKAKPVLDCLAKRVMHLGDYGSGSVAKLAINLLVGFNIQGLAETVLFAQNHGINMSDMLTIVNEGSCGNGLTKAKTQSLLSGDYKPAFSVKNTAKDMRLIRDAGIETPMAEVLINTYQDALKNFSDEDLMAVIKVFDK